MRKIRKGQFGMSTLANIAMNGFGNDIIDTLFSNESDFFSSNNQLYNGFTPERLFSSLITRHDAPVGGVSNSNLEERTGSGQNPPPPTKNIFKRFIGDPFKQFTNSPNAIAGADFGVNLLNSFLPEQREYSGPNGEITRSINSVWDKTSDWFGNRFGIVGDTVDFGMDTLSLVNKLGNLTGGGTDAMTVQDAILGSTPLAPIGWINGWGGQKADTIKKDDELFAQVGASYGATDATINDALQKSGKKYGMFSGGARHKATSEIREAKRQQELLGNVWEDTLDRLNIRNSMSGIYGNLRLLNMNGGYRQSTMRVGRDGLKIPTNDVDRILNKFKETDEGTIYPYQYYLSTLPEYQRNEKDYRVKDYWRLNGEPKDFDEAVKKGMFTLKDDTDESGKLVKRWHANSVAFNPETGEYEFMKAANHSSLKKELEWYDSDDAKDFREKYELVKTLPYYKYVPRKEQLQSTFKEGGKLNNWLLEVTTIPEECTVSCLKEVNIENLLPEFKEGGSFNIIPEGALHARKHNLDIKGITKKGIPVVSLSENGELQLQAEIERNEVIFRLEVTKKLEELCKKYNESKDDECAIEAGKLLVYELLENTVDNTGLINETNG